MRALIGALAVLTIATVSFLAASSHGVTAASAGSVGAPAAVEAVAPELLKHFAIFREAPPASMPEDVAASLASPARFGRNAAFAREVSTPAGPGWVVPGDGVLCLIAPDPVDSYGTSCNKTENVILQGISVALRSGPSGAGYITALIPDGAQAKLNTGSLPLRSDRGVVSAKLVADQDLEVTAP